MSDGAITALEALEKVTRDYVADYAYSVDEDGPDYVPCPMERDIILDAINGLVADPGFIAALEIWRLTTCLDASIGTVLIARERFRQMEEENATAEGDDKYIDGELRDAAIAYAMVVDDRAGENAGSIWPFPPEWFKTGNPPDVIRCLTKAGALIAAEIDRLERASS